MFRWLSFGSVAWLSSIHNIQGLPGGRRGSEIFQNHVSQFMNRFPSEIICLESILKFLCLVVPNSCKLLHFFIFSPFLLLLFFPLNFFSFKIIFNASLLISNNLFLMQCLDWAPLDSKTFPSWNH